MDEMIKALKEAYDLQTCKEIIEHGCVSGVCHNHIYYSQCYAYNELIEQSIMEYEL